MRSYYLIPTNINEDYKVDKAVNDVLRGKIPYIAWKNFMGYGRRKYKKGDIGYLVVDGLIYAKILFQEPISTVTEKEKIYDLSYWHTGEFDKACEQAENIFYKVDILAIKNDEYRSNNVVRRLVSNFAEFHLPIGISPESSKEVDSYLKMLE